MHPSSFLDTIIKSLPHNPGVYQYYDKQGTLIYVGKAKDLKKRVSSYFQKEIHESGKTAILVSKINDIKYIIVETEFDALLLENNLIKKYKPRYNVLLKDDKTYPWICIKNEPFPRVFSTRQLIRDGSQYFGPYASVKMMNTLLDLIKQLYTLRNCTLQLSKENIEKKKFKVCLEYHIGNCKAPCVGYETEDDYNTTITQVKNIIKGNINQVVNHLKELMQSHSQKQEYEKAQVIKEKLDMLENFQSKSTIVSPSIHNVDVFSVGMDDKSGYINFLRVANGAIIQGHTIELKKKMEETPRELLQLGIAEMRQRFGEESNEIIVPFDIELEIANTLFVIPQRGDKKKLLELSQRNIEYYIKEKHKQESLVDPERHSKRILAQMKKDLRLPDEPVHIECFDNSNIQGAYPVAAMVVFKNAKPTKKEYRHFNIKTVEGPNDFASMEEVIYRRYKRLVDEKQPLPQLIVIDGGKGQLSSAMKSLEKLGLRGKISVIGIAKKLEEIYYPNDSLPLYIDKKSETLRVIQHMRNEAHRFGITHHRNKRSKGTIKTELTTIKGISDTTAQKLLQKFKSITAIKQKTEQELQEVIGNNKGSLVFKYFHS